ncbi:CdaR family protein [Catenibacillus scindens]|uniref:CdaR family protein n=1 Tax=Catenibacillus scindens TaxID=673271 RepID=UPI003208B133
MKKKLTNNLGLKLGSLVLAVVIWLLIQSVADPLTTKTLTQTVEVRNEEVLSQQDENYTYSIVSGETARFTISGRSSVINRLSASDFNVYADMSKLSIVDAVPVEITPKAYVDSNVEILPQSNTLQIELDELTTIQRDVTVTTSGTPADGYAVGSTSCEPSLVTISGPKKILENADRLVVSVNVEGRSSDFSEDVQPVLYDKNGDMITAETVDIELENPVRVNVEIWRTQTLDVILDFSGVTAADGYAITGTAYSPQQIVVTASDEDMEKSEIISRGSVTYSIPGEENLTETTEGVFPIADYLGDNLRLVDSDLRENGITYQITVEEEVSASWPVSFENIQLIGENSNFTYRLASGDDTVSITVTGTEENLDSARSDTSQKSQFYLDVTNCDEPGEYSATISASLPENISLAPGQEVAIIVEEAQPQTQTGSQSEESGQ